MKSILIYLFIIIVSSTSCTDKEDIDNVNDADIKGYQLLTDLEGHWVGSNETAFGNFDWFSFDFRPISSSHLHSIYEGGTNQNIITSIFIADFEGKQQIMARNGGWLGDQYRATYFVLDIANDNNSSRYYRLVDAVGKEKRAYIELKFENDTLYFDAYKDNSGTLDEPVHHMGFKGTNYNPSFSQAAHELFDFPQMTSEVNLENKFANLIDSDSALFLEEETDPFPRSQHSHLSDLKIDITKDNSILNDKLLLYVSKEPLINENGQVDFNNLNTKVIRTVDVQADESGYTTTYLHPDNYYITAFADKDSNYYPSQGDISSVSKIIAVQPESLVEMEITVNKIIE